MNVRTVVLNRNDIHFHKGSLVARVASHMDYPLRVFSKWHCHHCYCCYPKLMPCQYIENDLLVGV